MDSWRSHKWLLLRKSLCSPFQSATFYHFESPMLRASSSPFAYRWTWIIFNELVRVDSIRFSCIISKFILLAIRSIIFFGKVAAAFHSLLSQTHKSSQLLKYRSIKHVYEGDSREYKTHFVILACSHSNKICEIKKFLEVEKAISDFDRSSCSTASRRSANHMNQ